MAGVPPLSRSAPTTRNDWRRVKALWKLKANDPRRFDLETHWRLRPGLGGGGGPGRRSDRAGARLEQRSATRVEIESGALGGVAKAGVLAFKGVPYAAAPVGALRWRPPQPLKPWRGLRRAQYNGPIALQVYKPEDNGVGALPMSEDCLTLNVFTPANHARAKLPVMVWIYGGGFTSGATSIPQYSGANLAKKGVVLVSVAYRVGSFGFLAHPELSAENNGHSGNYGLLDQIAGLQWVKRNIAAFGGDPANVTVFGESAGA